MKKFSKVVIKLRALIIVVFILITALMAFFLKDIKINPDITTYLPENDSVVAIFNNIGKNYSSKSMAIIIVEAQKEVFTVETLKNINDLTTSARHLPGIDYVTSITNVLDIKKTEDGFDLGRLIDENSLPQTDEQCKRIKEYAMSKTWYKGRLVSADSRYTVIICKYNVDFDKNEVSESIKELVTSKHYPEKFYFEGLPFQFLSIMDYIKKDLLLLTPLIILLLSVVLFLSFRSVRGVIIPVIAVAMGVIWSMGLMSIFDVRLSPISDAIPVVLFAVGCAYGIHVYNRFRTVVRTPEDKLRQSSEALSRVGVAVLLSGITTVMGFLSFIFGAYLNIINEFGIFSALGVLFILIINVTFTPALLSYLPVEKIHHKSFIFKNFEPIDRFLEKLSDMVIYHPKKILVISLIFVLVMIAGMPFLKNKIDILNYFRPETDIRITASIMNNEFGGSLPIMVRVRGDIQDPATLMKMKKVQDFLEDQPDIKNVSCVVDFLEEMNDCMGEGKQLPDKRDKVANLMFLIEGDEMLRQMINNDKTEAIIQAYACNVDTKRYKEMFSSINKILSVQNSDEAAFAQTGLPGVYSQFNDSLMKNLLQSLILSLVLIFISMVILLRSPRSAFIGMIPLLFTIIIIFGFMGLSGMALDICTILIASITVGAGIDYSIHFITEYKHHIIQGRSVEDAIAFAIRISGKPISINVLTVMLGFLVLIFANLLPLVNFGILIAITMFFSGLGAITVLPAFLSLFKLKLVKENEIRITRLN
ncbi:MAG TPA: efflux RND transporter permease subunit [Bacteroidales bacterium]|nr:efflux RND transporter permease subunit [Bacteroidales bacterium]